jgi:hypothetical protein
MASSWLLMQSLTWSCLQFDTDHAHTLSRDGGLLILLFIKDYGVGECGSTTIETSPTSTMHYQAVQHQSLSPFSPLEVTLIVSDIFSLSSPFFDSLS